MMPSFSCNSSHIRHQGLWSAQSRGPWCFLEGFMEEVTCATNLWAELDTIEKMALAAGSEGAVIEILDHIAYLKKNYAPKDAA